MYSRYVGKLEFTWNELMSLSLLDLKYVMLQELVDAGCVFEERQGWERPGWFSPKGPAPVPQYDWYGSYGTPRNSDVRYENMLKADHTFGFSKSHQIVSIQLFVFAVS